ncbi:MAG TPA: zinc-dependent metalloprotease [Myxococcaceae bacterium]|nr:zinc-dependent metalloprotease [Myxococcaceae bacterium]
MAEHRNGMCGAALAGALFGSLLVTACGRGPELVDRTQPNYLRKSDLSSGTWYLQDTVVGVPPTSPVTFEGYQGALEKVRFEVQEKYLVAYRSYEYLPGADPSVDRAKSAIGKVVTVDGKPYRGAPVAAWPILSHFDRIREYNPATGEQSNILVENTTDRPWYERDFMRVNWGEQVITDYANLDYLRRDSGEFSTYVQPMEGRAGDDGFFADYVDVQGTQQLHYFDFTTRQNWSPGMIDYPGYGAVPYCWLNPLVDCRGAEIKVRTSALRVDEAAVTDYEPLPYDDILNKKFGFFRMGDYVQKPTYDRNYGTRLSGRLLYAARHNIWERAHDGNGRTLPVQDRQPKPIVYYLSENYPPELRTAARQVEGDWDQAFRRAVAVPRGLPLDQVPQMFYVCENPVPPGAPAACGEAGLHVRTGDLRYNMFNWVDQPQLAGPLGYGPSSLDPETGQIVHGVANLYGAGVDVYAGQTVQLLDVMMGDLSLEDLIAGRDVRNYLAQNRNPTDPRRPDGPAQSRSGLTSDPTQPLSSFAAVAAPLRNRLQAYRTVGSLPPLKEDRNAVVNALIAQNPSLEQAMADAPEIRAAVLAAAPGDAWRDKLQSDEGFYRTVARETLLRFNELEHVQKSRFDAAERESIWLAEFSDDAFIGLARDTQAFLESRIAQLQAEGRSGAEAKAIAREEVHQRVRNAIVRVVGAHEVGHTVGLHHNFAGSYDALNYQDGFWDLRKTSIGVLAGGQRVLPIAPQDLADASEPTQAQLDAGMAALKYSTVMDYSARFVLNAHGLGKYDGAAILFAYSGGAEPGWVEVFSETRADTDPAAYTEPNVPVPTTNALKRLTVRGAHVEIPLAMVEHLTPIDRLYTDKFHYTTLPFQFADKSFFQAKDFPFGEALEQGVRRMQARSYRPWSEMKPIYDAVDASLAEYRRNATGVYDLDWDRARRVVAPVAAGKPVEVPYMYCSGWEVGAVLPCNAFDSGADYYEQTRDWIDRYREYYVFSNFRRDRVFFDVFDTMSRKFRRFTSNLPQVYMHWLFNLYWYQFYDGYSTDQMEQFFGRGDPILQNYWTMAVVDGINHLLDELSTPSAGYFGKRVDTGRWVHLPQNNAENTRFDPAAEDQLLAAITAGPNAEYSDLRYVPRGPGRNMFTSFDTDGYDFFRRVNEMGHFWDQYGALRALSTFEANFLGVDTTSDQTRFWLPYYITFRKELSRTVSGVWLEDNGRYASGLIKQADRLADVRRPTFVHAEDYISGFVYPAPSQPLAGDPASPPEKIEASPTWSTRFFSELFGMAYFNANLELDFARQNQVFRLGSGENVTPAAGYEVVTFADPFGGGYSYAAIQKSGTTDPAAAPFEILQASQNKQLWDLKLQLARDTTDPTLKAFYEAEAARYEAKTRDNVRNLEMMRGLYGIFGQL